MLAQVLEEELDLRDTVILRLVAADTLSHHGAWKPDSEAWSRSNTTPSPTLTTSHWRPLHWGRYVALDYISLHRSC
jgi:hypothetical protein